ncbi:3-hexulose-6-phosphate synthase [Salimicrobium humidisoli]|uniref:3-hexulose-6-phosphate synthase n=1 Tax=Salimicrobium humidisoli TaxID=2029857 RepID=A0ABX4HUA3_9BACI|nr:3-hexulose-6-phosphate synthase [Salimicrobium humidisoli]PBB06495.1 Fe-S cluster assembly protein HesB [Salimicrobium humidisoli]
MKLQLALDRLTRNEIYKVLGETEAYVDIIEVGTGVIKEYGMELVRDLRRRHPSHKILADMKTCDAGKSETLQALEAGADVTTVMAFSSEETIKACLETAEGKGEVMIDLLGIKNLEKVDDLRKIGVDFVSLHIGKDQQQDGGISRENFSFLSDKDVKVAVAGGVNLGTIDEIAVGNPDVVIVGSGITKASNPKEAARKFKKAISE